MKTPKRHLPPANAVRRVETVPGETTERFKDSRLRRLKIRRMKYTCQTKMRVGNGAGCAPPSPPAAEEEGERREIHERVEISLSLASSSSSSEEEDRFSTKQNDGVVSYGSASLIGSRKEMEDAVSAEIGFVAKERGKCDFFGVYDGHGGAQVAEACRERLHRLVAEEVERSLEWDWEGILEGCFRKMDSEVAGNAALRTVGSTAVVVVIVEAEIVVANCGDCRAVMARGGEAIDLSTDHKPDRPDELKRIEEVGGKVINWNGQRVLGVLATSRSIGDQHLRPYVISKPEVTVTKRSSKDEFLILASDGLWDVMSSEVACQVVRKCLKGQIRRVCNGVENHQSRSAEAAALLAEIALAKGGRDNTSVVVVELRGTVTSD